MWTLGSQNVRQNLINDLGREARCAGEVTQGQGRLLRTQADGMWLLKCHRGSLMCRLQSEDGEYNGMCCCHDGVPLWFWLQRADGCAQTSWYISQPTEKVRQHTDQSGKSNQRYNNLSLAFFLLCVFQSQADTNNNMTLWHQPRSWCHRLEKC